MTRGIDLAVEHIKAAGGPSFVVKYYDHKSGDPAAGRQAIVELGEAGYPAKLASYADDLGAMLAGTAQYKIFTFDGGGGAPIYAQGQPYYWGTRAITPDDVLPGLFKWLAATQPGRKTVGLTGWDVGEPNNTTLKTTMLRKIEAAGYDHNGLWELFPIGTQDFNAVLPKLKANEPDILLLAAWTYTGDVAIEIEWTVHLRWRYESDRAVDVDNSSSPSSTASREPMASSSMTRR